MRRLRPARLLTPVLGLVLGALALAGCGGSGSRDASGRATTACQRIGIPAYFDLSSGAGGSGATPLLTAGRALGFAVLNPASGPGTAPDAGYESAIARLRRQSKVVVGYVDTDYGRRPATAVLADVDHWNSWYGVVNVFFDQTPTARSEFARYRQYVDAVHAAGGKALLNPGTYPDRAYLQLADVSVTFEGSYADYAAVRVPAWAKSVDPRKVWHLVYSTPVADLAAALHAARDRGAGFVYVTDDALPDPWNAAASYWTDEQTRVAGAAAGCDSEVWPRS